MCYQVRPGFKNRGVLDIVVLVRVNNCVLVREARAEVEGLVARIWNISNLNPADYI